MQNYVDSSHCREIKTVLDCFGLPYLKQQIFKWRPRNDEDPAGPERVFKHPESSSLRGLPTMNLKKMFIDGNPKQTKFITDPARQYLCVHECQLLIFYFFYELVFAQLLEVFIHGKRINEKQQFKILVKQ